VARIHGDFTDVSGPRRVRDLIDDEAEDRLIRCFAIINVRPPIRGPLFAAPMAPGRGGRSAFADQ
jgi:hypothetical protein